MSFGAPSMPPPPPAPVLMPVERAAPTPPTQADAGAFARASRAAGGRAQGLASNIKTSPTGVMGNAPRAAKTFLGE